MKMALLLQLIPAFLFSLAAASAQNISDPKPQQAADALLDHRVWREEHGLPVDRIKDIIQTRDGYLWLVTSHGLARFDGVRFTVFNRANTSAFRADDCWILVEGEEGALWIATPHGLITYSKGHFRGFGAEDGLTDDFIGAMTYGHKTGLWVGTGAGLSRYQHGHWTTYRISDGVLTAPVLRLHEDHAGRIWVGTVKGLQILDPATSRFSADLPQHPYSSNNVFGIHTDADGTAWILYFDRDNSSFHLMRFKNGEALELPMPFVNLDGYRLTVSSQSILGFLRVSERWPMEEWFAKDAPHQLILPVPPHDVIISHLEDHEGGLWVGTRNSGLHRFRVEPKPISRLLDGLPSGMTWTVAQDEHGILWAGTDKGLARCADGKVTTFGIQGGLSDEYVRSLSFDKQGRLWVGSADGLDVFENGRLRSVSFPGTGLERKVRAVLWARDDSLWLGTDGGGFRQSSGNWTSLTATNGLGDNRAPLLLEDGAGDVWIGTVAGGLHRWRAGQVARFTSNGGLAS